MIDQLAIDYLKSEGVTYEPESGVFLYEDGTPYSELIETEDLLGFLYTKLLALEGKL